uniref:Uncharacterized protein n=1 Tax=Branchiostoma floridae TaxID=7739 RepID=C3Y5L5_BRAFL|eukprot:XP_002608252.1 hypothetical protein BRAFLDRAFT_87930 [Branchiostoma floridae]
MWADQSMLGDRTQTGLDLTEVLDLSVMSVVSATPPNSNAATTSCTPKGTITTPSPLRVVATPLRVPVSDKKTVQQPPTPQRVAVPSPSVSTPQRVLVQSTPTVPMPMRVPVVLSTTTQTTPAVSNGTVTKALPGRVAASTVTKSTVTKTTTGPVRVHGKPDRKPQSSRALFTEQTQPNRTDECTVLQLQLGPGPLATSSMMSEDSLNLPYDKTMVLSSSQTVSRPEDLPVVKQEASSEGSASETMEKMQEGQDVTYVQAVSTHTPNNQSAAKKAKLDQSYVIMGDPLTPAVETEETNAGGDERRMTFTKDDLRPEGQENTASCSTFPTPGHTTAGKRRSLGDVNPPAVAGQHVEQLRKVGLPSMMDKGTFPPPKKPSYMSLTASAAFKRKKHRRSVSSRENFTSKERQSPVAKETTKPAGTRRKFGFRRSLSCSF